MATITIHQPDGTKEVTTRDASDNPSLEELQAAVGGGLIQAVDQFLTDGSVAYANEEGLLRGMPINMFGARAVNWPEPLVGPIVVLSGFNSDED